MTKTEEKDYLFSGGQAFIIILLCLFVGIVFFIMGRATYPVDQRTQTIYFTMSTEEKECNDKGGEFRVSLNPKPPEWMNNTDSINALYKLVGFQCVIPEKVIKSQ